MWLGMGGAEGMRGEAGGCVAATGGAGLLLL